ncbi:MAG: TerB family tellurite resistance protein [Rhodospirillales bacterium]|jgi:uncharacterized tellurite resistance protein B-like protein|nr:TerB family tellurite resistance protein [Rhodospirillales bacterium]MBT4041266.1 TerB family tellurite resistance protein [Rhodospirillales bacterium]MBT4628099.1 TerB family tellurite resistance protein [Rhodospirillales bacterium]MBT5351714.1 TerB family tellurite resistance protein [Rhodospirillales bacterium]MBT5519340.1 TerB family tellurite resistance protein [Rhodospirillales bacterium]
MIKRIRILILGGDNTPEPDPEQERRAVTAALLIQAALMDGHFDQFERDMIESLLYGEFGLSQEEAHQLMVDAEQAVHGSAHLFGFTRIATATLSHQDCVDLVEMLWLVVYADGKLDELEANLLLRVASLLNVTDRESALARQRALGN